MTLDGKNNIDGIRTEQAIRSGTTSLHDISAALRRRQTPIRRRAAWCSWRLAAPAPPCSCRSSTDPLNFQRLCFSRSLPDGLMASGTGTGPSPGNPAPSADRRPCRRGPSSAAPRRPDRQGCRRRSAPPPATGGPRTGPSRPRWRRPSRGEQGPDPSRPSRCRRGSPAAPGRSPSSQDIRARAPLSRTARQQARGRRDAPSRPGP